MSNFKIIENKISAVRKYRKILDSFVKYSRSEIEKDLLIRGSLERYLYLMVQSAIDLADAFIAYRNFRKPTSLKESFHILNEENVISQELTERMSKMAGFRNIITHDYINIDYDIVYDILRNHLQDIEEFLSQIEKQIK